METAFRMLGAEGDQVDGLAALHGIAASLALAIVKRIVGQGGGRHVTRQARIVGRVATTCADAFDQDDNLDDASLAKMVVLMTAAGRAERRGLRYDRLLKMPAGWLAPTLAITAPTLGLCAGMRLGQALERLAIAGGDPRRLVQLAAIRNLESRLTVLDCELRSAKITSQDALRRVIAVFSAAGAVIGGDNLSALLGGDPPAVLPY